jgi:hypothetical protein
MSIVGKFDFSFVDDPNPVSAFNPGRSLREVTDRLWGDVATNLPTEEGAPIYHRLNDGLVAGSIDPVAVPPIIAFNGRWDTTVGWAEKIPFYGAMRTYRQGGYFYWDNRDHLGSGRAAWTPLQDPRYLYRFRTNLSFPAISNCSTDGDPGNGDPAAGDSVGCINGFVEWDTQVLDDPTVWEATLWARDLQQLWGTATAPDSLVADVTPRRLQRFKITQGTACRYGVTRVSDGALVQSGVLFPDGSDLVTVPAVKVYRGGTRVRLEEVGAAGVGGGPSATRLQLRLSRNPVGTSSTVELYWPVSGEARVDLLDVAGRVVRTLHRGPVAAGATRLRLSTGDLESGVYFVSARQGREQVTGRAVVLR